MTIVIFCYASTTCRHYIFGLSFRRIRPFIRADFVTTIFHEWLKQFHWNIQGITTGPYRWLFRFWRFKVKVIQQVIEVAKASTSILKGQSLSSWRWWEIMFLLALVDIYYRYIGIYVCEQLPGTNSSPVVTRLCQSYPWPQGTSWLNFEGRSRWGRYALYWTPF